MSIFLTGAAVWSNYGDIIVITNTTENNAHYRIRLVSRSGASITIVKINFLELLLLNISSYINKLTGLNIKLDKVLR